MALSTTTPLWAGLKAMRAAYAAYKRNVNRSTPETHTFVPIVSRPPLPPFDLEGLQTDAVVMPAE